MGPQGPKGGPMGSQGGDPWDRMGRDPWAPWVGPWGPIGPWDRLALGAQWPLGPKPWGLKALGTRMGGCIYDCF